MGDTSKQQRPAEAPKRGEAAWRAEKEAIASRNEQASRRSRGAAAGCVRGWSRRRAR